MPLLTVGHGTLAAEALVQLLAGAGVAQLVDVRSYPGSRHNPQVAREQMEVWVPEGGIAYRWERRLGGRRRPRPDSPHHALRNDGFRGYADHMEGADFRTALGAVLADEPLTAVMCSESVWWRCHRRLVADALVAQGRAVCHIGPDGRLAPHELTEFARVAEGGRVTYPASGEEQLGLE